MLETSVSIAGLYLSASSDQIDERLTLLDALSIRWGRTSSLDQPAATTLSMSLLVPPDRSDLIEDIQPGLPVEVIITNPDGLPVSLPSPAVGRAVIPSSVVTLISGQTLTFTPTSTNPLVILFPPGVLQPSGTDPRKWDNLGQVTQGDELTITAEQSLPPGATTSLHPAYFPTPYIEDAWVDAGASAAPGMSFTVPAQMTAWVGLALKIANPMRTFATMPGTFSNVTKWGEIDRFSITAPQVSIPKPAPRRAHAFAGRITDADATWYPPLRRAHVQITAADVLAELANARMGASPWPAQSPAARLSQITTASPVAFQSFADATLTRNQAADDVDAQPTASLLADLAISSGAVLWPSSHQATGPYLWLEDPRRRRAMHQLTVPDTGPITVTITGKQALPLDAAYIRRDGITLRRDVDDLATVVTATWIETVTTDDKTTEIEHTEIVADTQLLQSHGYRSIGIRSRLTNAADARALATETLARARPEGWRIPKARIDQSEAPDLSTELLFKLLDSSTRPGLPLMLHNVAKWVPGAPTIPAFVDGGTWQHTGHRWILDLDLTKDSGHAGALRCNQTPDAATWTRMSLVDWETIATTTT